MFKRQRDRLVHHFHAAAEAGFVDLHWKPAEPDLRFRLLRAEHEPAELLWEGTDSAYQDRGVAGRRHYVYVLQAQGPDGLWREAARARVKAKFAAVDRSAIEADNVATGAYDAHPNR